MAWGELMNIIGTAATWSVKFLNLRFRTDADLDLGLTLGTITFNGASIPDMTKGRIP